MTENDHIFWKESVCCLNEYSHTQAYCANIEKCENIHLNVVRGYVNIYTKVSYSQTRVVRCVVTIYAIVFPYVIVVSQRKYQHVTGDDHKLNQDHL